MPYCAFPWGGEVLIAAHCSIHNQYAFAERRRGLRPFYAIFVGILILAAPAKAQILSVSPNDATPLIFSGIEGGPFIPSRATSWTLRNSGIATLAFSVATTQPWLGVDSSSGEIGESILARFDVSAALSEAALNMAPGVYPATVTFTNLTNGNGSTSRRVELHVAPASFAVAPGFINVLGVANGAGPAPVNIVLSSNGLVDLNYELSWPSRPWLNVFPSAGTVPGGGTTSAKLHFNTFGLPAGTYTVAVNVKNSTNDQGNRELPVTLIVQPATAGAVLLSPETDVEAAGPVGNIAEASTSFLLTNMDLNPVQWIAGADQDWVTISPAGGTLAGNLGSSSGPHQQSVEFRVNAARNDLPAGSHSATVMFEQVFVNPLTGIVTRLTLATRLVRVSAAPVLSVSLPQSGGRVLVSPSGRSVAGGTSQSIQFPYGEVVTLTTSVEDGFEFDGWAADFKLDAALQNPLVVTMDGAKRVSAIVTPIARTLTLSTSGLGTGTTVTAPTAVITENALVSRYDHGTSVTLTAAADDGSVFVGWAGNVPPGAQHQNPLEVAMDRDRVITARFEPGTTLFIDIVGNGDVQIDPDLDSYGIGSVVTLTAIPDMGASFNGWSGAATGTEPSVTLTLLQDTLVTATFGVAPNGGSGGQGGGGGGSGNLARLIVDIQGDGAVTPFGGNFAPGARVTLIATPGLGSSFVRWEGGASGTQMATVITMDSDRTVRAVFQPGDGSVGRPTPPQTCGALGMLGSPLLLAIGMIFIAPAGRRTTRRLCR